MTRTERLAWLLDVTGIAALSALALRWRGVLTFNYHRIGSAAASPFDRGLWSADAEAFSDQVRYCKTRFDLVTPDALDDLRRRRGRAVMITFDDGYLDNYTTAFPILCAERVPATFFVTTDFIDGKAIAWWDEIAWMIRTSPNDRIRLAAPAALDAAFDEPDRERAVRMALRAYKRLPATDTTAYLDVLGEATRSGRWQGEGGSPWMSWPMLRRMEAAGMAIGGHTMTHPVLARADRDTQRAEVLGCAARLASELGRPMHCFSYPVGGRDAFDRTTRECLRDAGVRYAFSYYGGYAAVEPWDEHDVRRLAVESDTPASWFRVVTQLPQLFA